MRHTEHQAPLVVRIDRLLERLDDEIHRKPSLGVDPLPGFPVVHSVSSLPANGIWPVSYAALIAGATC